jgi:hypothetical protein
MDILINNYVIPSICVSYFVFIWLETNAFYEYLFRFRVFNIFPSIKKYKEKNFCKDKEDFAIYLLTKNEKSFFEKLFSCHVCVAFWLSVCYAFMYDFRVKTILVVAFLSLLFYKVIRNE